MKDLLKLLQQKLFSMAPKGPIAAPPLLYKCFACDATSPSNEGWKPVSNVPGAQICAECHAWIAKG